jgi:moderate conductance mechanosensitive channel
VTIRMADSPFQQAFIWFTGAPLRISTVIIVALFVLAFGGRAINRAMSKLSATQVRLFRDPIAAEAAAVRRRDRAMTIGSILHSALSFTVALVAIAMVLGELGLNLAPIVASAGILGIAIGLGSQSLVKGFISGLFLIVEDQFGVGDHVRIDNVEGVVESVGLRSTTIRSADGVLWFIRNGDINKVGNFSAK